MSVLDLTFERRAGRSVLSREYACAPLAYRAVGPPDVCDPVARGRLLTLGGGLLAGQGVSMRVCVQPGAGAWLETVGATLVRGAASGCLTTSSQAFTVASGGALWFLPEPLIPGRGARYRQTTEITLAEDAVLVYGEAIAPGRAWHGERFAYERVELALRLQDWRARPLRVERVVLEPARHSLQGPGRLAGWTHLGTLIAAGPRASPALAEELHALLADHPVRAGATPLHWSAVEVRVLAATGQALMAALRAASTHAWRRLHHEGG